MYQRMYGCQWDEQTKESHGFDQHGYDGEDYISLDVENSIYITSVPQGLITTARWNADTAQLTYLRQYYRNECISWVFYFLISKKVDLERRGNLFLRTSLCSSSRSFFIIIMSN